MIPSWSLVPETQFYLVWGILFCVFAYGRLNVKLAAPALKSWEKLHRFFNERFGRKTGSLCPAAAMPRSPGYLLAPVVVNDAEPTKARPGER